MPIFLSGDRRREAVGSLTAARPPRRKLVSVRWIVARRYNPALLIDRGGTVQPIIPQRTNSQLSARAALVRAVRRAHIGRGYDALLLRVAVWEFARAARQGGIRRDRMLVALSSAIDAGMLGGCGDAARATMLDRATWWATDAYVESASAGPRAGWSAEPNLLAS